MFTINDIIDSKRITPTQFTAIIEIQKGSKMKYEMDKETGYLRLDRVLYTSTHYPQNYGFIPKTLSEDGDQLDVLVLTSESIVPNTLVDCKPVGVVLMKDNNEMDEKIVAVCSSDPFYNMYNDMDELPKHVFDEIVHFFTVYKYLEGKKTEVFAIKNKEAAIKIIKESIERYNDVKKGNQ